MKKKILTLLVCAAVMLTTACDNSGITSASDNSASTPSSPESSAPESSAPESSTPESSAPESSAPVNSTPESSTTESSAPAAITAGEFAHGTQAGNTYTSEYLGFKIDFADGWTMQTDEELAQNNGVSDMSDENANKALETNAMLYEMWAATDAVANMNINIENLDLTNNGKLLSGEEYIDAVLNSLEAQYQALGIEDVTLTKSTVSFLGGEEACIDINLVNNGVTMVQKMLAIGKDCYMVTISLTGASDQEIESQLAMFTKA